MPHATSPQQTPPPPPPRRRSWLAATLLWMAGLIVALGVLVALLLGYALLVAGPQLPSLDAVTDYRPKVPMRIYTADHVLIGEFGEERRKVVRFDDIPDMMKKAVLAVEDDRFYQHGGIDFVGIVRAGVANVIRGGSAQGASTITMQVARNFFLSSEKTYTRKIYEMLLSYKIENALTKDQILELYMNQIYLGQRAYGFASAAEVYFGKGLKDITLAQAAMLAGLPKAPSANNPITNPKRAQIRQRYILKRMLDLGYIQRDQYEQALAENVHVHATRVEFSVHAEYIAEIVRQMMFAQYHEEAYTRGLNIVTTIDSGDQEAAYEAVRSGIMDYDKRHGYRGPEAFVTLPENEDERNETIEATLLKHPDNGEIVAAVVLAADRNAVRAMLPSGETIDITGNGLRFAAGALPAGAKDKERARIRRGSVIRLVRQDETSGKEGKAAPAWQITQLPQVEGALVSLTPQDGAMRALVGGFDFNKNKFNHVTQAWRQPGSSFKPFIYSASLEQGLGPATLIDDAPLFFPAPAGGKAWAPKNYGGSFDGPMTMRTALMKSKNLVTVRIMQHIGPKYAQDYVTRFGFDADKQPAYLPMALGAGLVTPLQMASGYSVFANGGYRVNPYLIAEITDINGAVVSRAQPLVADANAPRVITAPNDYIMYSLLHDVATRGTGARTNVLKRGDLAGKTGTTNDSRDAWFAGYQRSLVAVAWIGYDQPRSLGDKETGGGIALPVWTDYMRHALKGVPEYKPSVPEGVATLGGELYLADKTPGAGFVATVGISQPNAEGTPAIDDSERQQVLDMFSTGGSSGGSGDGAATGGDGTTGAGAGL
ncbi:penicillin-binding protein 1A [Robbsia sp. Bb-Pol-6]|uniref:Penicillin-binding protein 1A n=1 Tax=Robbsia betulipollinis TaxID=2981849 RepID=A0ABT3ZQW3_9BURK|nr:penicillin-binding protein 1A [Robbsia betulipollinis]MCY0388325.1 penicillin-binding protein 1A [Robbsia betulipollinis]